MPAQLYPADYFDYDALVKSWQALNFQPLGQTDLALLLQALRKASLEMLDAADGDRLYFTMAATEGYCKIRRVLDNTHGLSPKARRLGEEVCELFARSLHCHSSPEQKAAHYAAVLQQRKLRRAA